MQAKSFRVLSLNLWSDPLEKLERTQLLMEKIKEVKPDYILLQENSLIEDHPLIAKNTSVASYIATQCNYNIEEINSFSTPAILYKGESKVSSYLTIENRLNQSDIMKNSKFGYFPFIIVERDCHKLLLLSAHMPWGPREHLRMESASWLTREIERIIEENEVDMAIMGGDFNAKPESDSIRFLEGLHVYDKYSTLWINSAKTLGYGDYPTSSLSNKYARKVAESVGIIESSEVPNRTIDYQFTYGYAYGKAGYPQNLEFITNPNQPISDHVGLLIDYRC